MLGSNDKELGVIWISLVLASSVPIILIGGLWQRIRAGKGIGWQFIRYTAIATGLPIAGVLALTGVLSSEIATLFAAVIGFAFGKSGDS